MMYLSASCLNFTRTYIHLHALHCNPPLSFFNEPKEISGDLLVTAAAARLSFSIIFMPTSIILLVLHINGRKMDEESNSFNILIIEGGEKEEEKGVGGAGGGECAALRQKLTYAPR